MVENPAQRSKLRAVVRKAAMILGPLSACIVLLSSPMVTSLTECKQFSLVQCPRCSGAARAQVWQAEQAGLSPHSVPPLSRHPWIASIDGSQRLALSQANRSTP